MSEDLKYIIVVCLTISFGLFQITSCLNTERKICGQERLEAIKAGQTINFEKLCR